MVKNGIFNLMKYFFFVTLATVLSFSFAKVDCFADSFTIFYRMDSYDIQMSADNPFIVFTRGSNQYLYFGFDNHAYYNSLTNGQQAVTLYSNSSFSDHSYLQSGIKASDVVPLNFEILHFNDLQDALDYFSSVPGDFNNDLPELHFEVYYNTPLLLNDSLVIKCTDRPLSILDSYSKFDVELSEPSGTVFFSDHFYPNQFSNLSGEVRVPGVFDDIDFNGTVYYKIIPYDENGDWGQTILGSFQLGSTGSGEPLDNPYLIPSVNGVDIVGTVPVISTSVEDKDIVPSSYLSSSNLPNITYNINNYYVYDTSDPSQVPSGTTEDTYIDYTINTIDIPQGDPDLFAPVQDYYDSDYKNKVSGILSVFQNLFPFLPDGLIKGLSFLLAVIIGLIVVLIAIKLIGLIL